MMEKKASLLCTLTALGWALFLGPQLQPYAATAKHEVLRQWHQWQQNTTTNALPTPVYTTRIVSYDPFIMHIENFVSVEERKYLLDFGIPLLERSHVMLENGTSRLDDQRTSSTGYLGKSDPIIQRVLERAGQIQGFVSIDSMEDLQLTAYAQGQQYTPHYDWFFEHLVPIIGNQNRGSTFFVTLDADCENCGTQFPRVPVDWRNKDPRWCEFVECENNHALTVKAKPGSAVFWQNLDAEGYGNPKTLHAGLPVPEGKKIGMNIWTRVAPLWAYRVAVASA